MQMKRKNIIILLWGLWLCSLIIAAFSIYQYIENKRNKLYSEIRENIEKLFEGQSSGGVFVSNYDGFFDEAFSGYPVRHYKKVAIPSKTGKSRPDNLFPEMDERRAEEWEECYGDLVSLYELNWGDEYPNQNDEGWNIIRIYGGGINDDFIQTNTIFPYQVGFIKTNWGNPYTVEEAVNKAFDFYTKDSDSRISDRFQRGSNKRLWSSIYDCNNAYYTIVENKELESWKVGKPICQPEDKSYEEAQRIFPYENGWMGNGYFRVFIAATQERHYMIKENEWVVDKDRNVLFIWWGIGLSILFLMFIIPLTVKENKSKCRKTETLYQRLVRICNPKEFIQNYDKEKVDKANNIYQRLMNTKPDNQEELMEIQAIAVSELGVNLIDIEQLEELKEKVNPKKFLNPYNAEKVFIANELYAILSKEGLTYNEIVEVEEKAKLL